MRPIFILLFWLGIGAGTSFAQPFRIVTWQVDNLPPTKAGTLAPPGEEQVFAETAATLNATDADVIILYGVQDMESARKVAGLLKVRKYSTIHHTAFRHGQRGPLSGVPFAILSRRDRIATKNIEWTHTGRIDNMPGGFAFAALRFNQTAVSIYVTSLPGSLTNGVAGNDGAYFARKRGYAAQYLAHHIDWLGATLTNPAVAIYVTGDFQTPPKAPVNDASAKLLETAGFKALSPGTATDKTTSSVTNNASMDRVQDPIFTKGVEFIASRQINRPAPEHPLVVCELTFKAPGTSAKAATKPAATKTATVPTKPTPKVEAPPAPITLADVPAPIVVPPASSIRPRPEASSTTQAAATGSLPSNLAPTTNALAAVIVTPPGSTQPRQLTPGWIGSAAAGSMLALGLAGWWFLRRTNSRTPAPTTPKQVMAPQQYLELPTGPTSETRPGPEATVLRESSTATGQTDRVPWEDPAVRSGRGTSNARMTPQLRQLMREVVVAWLARQRTQLLESHERGTEQVLELHSQVERIKEQFQSRLRSQQQRIAELDTALRSKDKLILDLVRAKRSEE